MTRDPIRTVDLPLPKRQGKVRDIFDLGDSLLIVSTDRISAFDWILPTPIPQKGEMLTDISRFWFEQLGVPNHLISTRLPDSVATLPEADQLEGRSMHVRKAEVIPFECVVRGYLEGSGWKDYQANGSVCGINLPKKMEQCQQLPEPIFTPATKATAGHDENVSFDHMKAAIGETMANELKKRSLEIYRKGCEIAAKCGLIIADTKFEFGRIGDEIILIDEVLTPDSSRFWPELGYEPGRAQSSFDKQFVREYLVATNWDRESAPPELPNSIVQQTCAKYAEARDRLLGTIDRRN